jgi:hypothetical protein
MIASWSDAAQRAPHEGRVGAQRLVGDALEGGLDQRHRGEHVPLREPYLDVHASDLRRLRAVRLVVGSGNDPLHPPDERPLEPVDLFLSGEHVMRLLVLEDAA